MSIDEAAKKASEEVATILKWKNSLKNLNGLISNEKWKDQQKKI